MNIKNIIAHCKTWPAIGAAIVIGVVAAFVFSLERGYAAQSLNAAADSRKLALAVEHHAAATIQKTDLTLIRLVDEFSPEYGDKWLYPKEISDYLRKLRLKQPEIKSLRIIKADGHVLYALMDGDGAASPPFLGEETYFTAHRDNPRLGLTLSEPSQGHGDPGRNLLLIRRLNNPDGSFAGIATAGISLTHFEDFYASLHPGNNSGVALLGRKFAVLAGLPAGGGLLEAHVQKNPLAGTYSGISPVDGVARVFSFRQVGDLPLYVHVGLAKTDFLAEWRRSALTGGAALAVLTALIAAMLFFGGLRRPVVARKEEPLPSSLHADDPIDAGEIQDAPAVAEDADECSRSEHLLKSESIEDIRARHLASIALLRKRADESLKRLKQDMERERQSMRHLRLAMASEIIGDIAHQWRQPLNSLDLMLADIKVAQKFNELDPQALLQSTVEGRRMIHEMFGAIDDYRYFFKPGKEKTAFSLNREIRDVVETFSNDRRDDDIKAEVEAGEEVIAYGLPNVHAEVLLSILNNARDALAAHHAVNGIIQVRAAHALGQAAVIVRVNAAGVPEKLPASGFAAKRKGARISLRLSKMLIEDGMDGKIKMRNIEGGTEFVVTCPAAK